MMPISRRSPSTTQVMPEALAGISSMTSRIGSSRPTTGAVVAAVHQLPGAHQALAEHAAGVQVGEVLGLESLLDQHRHRQRVAQRQRRGGAARSAPDSSGRPRPRRWQSSTTSAAWASVDRGSPVIAISRAPIRLMVSSTRGQLLGLAAVRHRDHDVVGLDHAEVAVHRFGRDAGRRPAIRCSRTSRRSCGR